MRANFKLTPPMLVSHNKKKMEISIERNGRKSKVKTKEICKYCGRLFARKDTKDSHEKVVHLKQGEKFECEICHVGYFANCLQKYAQIAAHHTCVEA